MPDWTGVGQDIAATYVGMADTQLAGISPSYEAVCRAVAVDADAVARLAQLPAPKRQPNLLLGAVRYLGGPTDDPQRFLDWSGAHWPEVVATMTARRTQTNEPARCATLLPVLAELPGPLALLEVGASAGLCLYPDRYAYRYLLDGGREHRVGTGGPEFTCTVTGPAPLPDRVPDVRWRAGLDLNPLDVTDPDDVRWLESLVWPEQTSRFTTLAAAVEVARADPPRVVAGDLRNDLDRLVHSAPVGTTLVVFHSAVLAYLGPGDRAAFVQAVTHLDRDVVWIANEAPGVVVDAPPGSEPAGRFLLARDGVPVAWTGPHGQALERLPAA